MKENDLSDEAAEEYEGQMEIDLVPRNRRCALIAREWRRRAEANQNELRQLLADCRQLLILTDSALDITIACKKASQDLQKRIEEALK